MGIVTSTKGIATSSKKLLISSFLMLFGKTIRRGNPLAGTTGGTRGGTHRERVILLSTSKPAFDCEVLVGRGYGYGGWMGYNE